MTMQLPKNVHFYCKMFDKVFNGSKMVKICFAKKRLGSVKAMKDQNDAAFLNSKRIMLRYQ
jgi:hypothetical protein